MLREQLSRMRQQIPYTFLNFRIILFSNMEEIGIYDFQQESTPVTRATTGTTASADVEEDLYIKFKKLQRQIEFLQASLLSINVLQS